MKQTHTTRITQSKPLSTDVVWNMIHKGAQFEVLSSMLLGLKQTYTTCVTQSKPLSTDVVWNMIHEGAQFEVL